MAFAETARGTPACVLLMESELPTVASEEIPAIRRRAFAPDLIAATLYRELWTFALQERLGQVCMQQPFRSRRGRAPLCPDVAFVAGASGCGGLSADPSASWEVTPTLAVEVVTPTTTAEGLVGRVFDFLAEGAQMVWAVYLRTPCIYVYESRSRIRILRGADELDGGTALPGFRLKLADLFAALVNPT